jgi:hypothetical protein
MSSQLEASFEVTLQIGQEYMLDEKEKCKLQSSIPEASALLQT